MPIYGYECTQCGHHFEVLQSVSEERLSTCPECMGPLRKLLYPVGVIFKGSGFYTTDYKGSRTESNGSVSGDSATSGDSKSGGEGKSDKKPDSSPSAD